jgi:hypothetical protein
MAREYILGTPPNSSVQGAVDCAVLFINPSATIANACGLEMLRAWASQSANATSAQQGVALRTQVTAFPTLTGATPRKTKFLDPASLIVSGTAGAAGTCGILASVAGAGTKSEVVTDNFNVLNGWLWVPTPRETIVMPAMAASGFGLYFPVQPTTLTGWSSGLTYAELG